MERLPKDLSKISNDPTANPAAKNLVDYLKNVGGHGVFEQPEWKKEQFNKKIPGRTDDSGNRGIT